MTSTFPSIYLIRHGATEWSVTGQHTGRSDIPLTALGEAEALRLKPHVASLLGKNVLVSPLRRARRTAELLGFENAVIEPNIAEWSYGDYEGLKTDEIRKTRTDWKILEDGCPNGESVEDVEARALTVIRSLRDSDEDCVLVAHGHFLAVFAGCWLGLGGRGARFFHLGTASLSILSYHHGLDEPVVRLWNDRTVHRP